MDANSSPNTLVGSNHVPNDTVEPQTIEGMVQDQEAETHAPNPSDKNQPQTKEKNVSSSPNKLGLKSDAWKHFKREKIDDKWKAICKYCERKLGGETRQGTKHLHDHIRTCKLRTVRGPKQSILNTVTQSTSSVGGVSRSESLLVGTYAFNQEEVRKALGQMIVMHEFPLSMVDHVGFRYFLNLAQPLLKINSRNTVRSDIMKMYEIERGKIQNMLERNACQLLFRKLLETFLLFLFLVLLLNPHLALVVVFYPSNVVIWRRT